MMRRIYRQLGHFRMPWVADPRGDFQHDPTSRGLAPCRIDNRLTVNHTGHFPIHRFQGMPKRRPPRIFLGSYVDEACQKLTDAK